MSSLVGGDSPEFGKQDGRGTGIATLLLLLAIAGVLLSPQVHKFIGTGHGSVSDTTPTEILPPASDLNLTDLLAILNPLGIKDLHQVTINPLSPDITEIILPGGIDKIPIFSDEATSNGNVYDPLLQELIDMGAIVFTTEGHHIDYQGAFTASSQQGHEIFIPSSVGGERNLAIFADSHYINVYEQRKNDLIVPTMWAKLTDDGIVEFGIYTRDSNGNPYHSDLYAHEFFYATVKYFQGNHEVNGVEGYWIGDSTNLQVVNKLVQQGLPVEEAVRQTFTGRNAINSGFSKILITSIEQDPLRPGRFTKMVIEFLKESPTSQYDQDLKDTPTLPDWWGKF